jgi:hypothetical protein
MAERLVRVSFRKQVSDGNYGTEAAEVTLEDSIDSTIDAAQLAEHLLHQARTLVHAELAVSPAQRVRATVE